MRDLSKFCFCKARIFSLFQGFLGFLPLFFAFFRAGSDFWVGLGAADFVVLVSCAIGCVVGGEALGRATKAGAAIVVAGVCFSGRAVA